MVNHQGGRTEPFDEKKIKRLDYLAAHSGRARDHRKTKLASIKKTMKMVEDYTKMLRSFHDADKNYFAGRRIHGSDREEVEKRYRRQISFRRSLRTIYSLQDKTIYFLAVALGYPTKEEYIDYLIRRDLAERGLYNISDEDMDLVTSALDAVHDAYWWTVKEEARAMQIDVEILQGHKYKKRIGIMRNNIPYNKMTKFQISIVRGYNGYKDKLKFYEDVEEYANDRLKEGWAGGIQHATGIIRNVRRDRRDSIYEGETSDEADKRWEEYRRKQQRDKEASAEGVADTKSMGAKHSGE